MQYLKKIKSLSFLTMYLPVLILLAVFSTPAASQAVHCYMEPDFRSNSFTEKKIPSFVEPNTTPAYKIVDGQSCVRTCVKGAQPLVCTFKFKLAFYTVMGPACRNCPTNATACFEPQCVTADGIERGIIATNRQMPGPEIQVCKDDIIVVDVENHLPGSTVSIHWHGILQHDAQFMDGVPMITQCPIVEGTSFRYAFPAEEGGSFFWHSHDGFQKMDGVTGALIVRNPEDPSRRHYDFDIPEHVIMVHDWLNQFMVERIPGPRRPNRRGQLPDSLLINGRGSRIDPATRAFNQMPLSNFRVQPGGIRYRFRLIHAGCLICPIQFSIEGHVLQVIATDSFAVRPRPVNSIIMLPGERYDFVLTTSEEPSNYWMTIVALGECTNRRIIQNAILVYEGANGFASSARFPGEYPPPGVAMNPLNAACKTGDSGVCITQLVAENPPRDAEPVLTATDVRRLTIDFDFHQFTYDELFKSGKDYKFYVPVTEDITIAGRMNNISLMMPPSPPLSQPEGLEKMCASGSEMCCDNRPAEPRIATHRQCFNMISVPLGQVVEILYLDNMNTNGTMAHPIHMHGLMFYVTDMGSSRDRQMGLHLRPPRVRPFTIKKDTVTVPSNGYVKVRFNATNPGYWLIHCHVLVHVESGMGAILRIGTHAEMPKPPPGFPRCGNYLPSKIFV